MKDLFTVIEFTIKDMIKRKSFIISTIIIMLIILICFNIPNIIKNFDIGNLENKTLIVDSYNVFDDSLNTLNSMNLGDEFEISRESISEEEIKEKIKDKSYSGIIVIEKEDETSKVKVRYIVENAFLSDGVPEYLMDSLNSLYTELQMQKLGLTPEQVMSITPNFEYSIEQTKDEAEGNIFTMLLLSLVLFYAIYFCAYQVSSSITTEKTSKVMETLVTSTKPKTIVLGKTIGIGIVGLCQVCLLAGTALICAYNCLDKELLNMILDTSNITITLAIVTILYFILGYFQYALFYALTGSTVSKPEDIQSANGPVAIIAVIGFYLAYFTMMNPSSGLNVLASMLPISSPFCMPFRVMMGLASVQDVLISLAILLVTILVIAKIAIKIYSSAILNYGTKMSFKDIVRIYKEK